VISREGHRRGDALKNGFVFGNGFVRWGDKSLWL
jgi:hypothetical protein